MSTQTDLDSPQLAFHCIHLAQTESSPGIVHSSETVDQIYDITKKTKKDLDSQFRHIGNTDGG